MIKKSKFVVMNLNGEKIDSSHKNFNNRLSVSFNKPFLNMRKYNENINYLLINT